MPFKALMGWGVLRKNKQVQTVVNKIGKISSEFRVFEMEVIAGKPNFETEVREHGCRFLMDFSRVYWNSRLLTEHLRIVEIMKKEMKMEKQKNAENGKNGIFGKKGKTVLCDLFCGIGPFAVPAALSGIQVYANDLNPHSIEYLNKNLHLNKVQGNVKVSNLDARECFRNLRKREISEKSETSENDKISDFVMNYPNSGIQFLDMFRGAYGEEEELPMVHCYCFYESEEGIVEDASEQVGGRIREYSIHKVRNVAPKKNMYCISFRLPRSEMGKEEEEEEGKTKKQKC